MANIPTLFIDNFEDFAPLTLSDDERRVLFSLRSMSDQRKIEYGRARTTDGFSDAFTDNDANRVKVPGTLFDQGVTDLYHSHTNDSPFSSDDMRLFCRRHLRSLAVVTANNDVFVLRVGDGFVPDEEELDEFMQSVWAEATFSVMKYDEWSEWTGNERLYVTIREQMYLTARNFGWTIEGGKL